MSYHRLDTYQRAKHLYPLVVQTTRDFPRQGWHLRDQICRSANSIQANIAEGYGRSTGEFKMFLTRALGSCNETRSHIEDAKNVDWISAVQAESLLREYTVLSKQLYRLRESWHPFPISDI